MTEEETAADKAFRLLEGHWTMTREISPHGEVRGQADWRLETTGVLHYSERGRLRLVDGGRFDVSRSYRYFLDGTSIEIRFADGPDDGKTFLHLPFAGPLPRACGEHLCGKDLYEAEFWFETADRFWISYRVRGPKKDYLSKTCYTRAAPSQAQT